MNTTRFLSLVSIMVLLWACQPQEVKLALVHQAGIEGLQTPVHIPVAELELKGIKPGGDWLPFEGEKILPHQYDDLDGDGSVDELFLLLDFAADEQKEISFRRVEKVPDFMPRTHLRLGQKTDTGIVALKSAQRLNTFTNTETHALYQFEGIGWENDKVGFRNYLDLRNGIDIFGKTTPEMILDKVGVGGDVNYHHLQDWGMDILKVGTTLGAGSIALWYQDSLYRLTGPSAEASFVFEGPLRSRLKLSFQQIDLGDQKIDVEHTITIVAGTYSYDASVSISPNVEGEVIIGLVDLHNLPSQTLELSTNKVVYTYGLQSENKDSLGLALMIPDEGFAFYVDTDSISQSIPNTYAVAISPQDVHYRFYAGWEASSKDFDNQLAFQAYIRREIQLYHKVPRLEWRN